MGVFRAYLGCSGVVGFNGCCSWVSSGDGGFTVACISCCSGGGGCIVATSLRPVREIVRPARLDVGASAKKFALQAQNGRKTLFSGALGEFFRGGAAGGAVPGEFFRGLSGGGVVPKVQTVSAKNAEGGLVVAKWSAFWAQWGPRSWQLSPSTGGLNPMMRS